MLARQTAQVRVESKAQPVLHKWYDACLNAELCCLQVGYQMRL